MTAAGFHFLADEGFQLVTEWVRADGKIRLLSLDWPESSGWLYAFVVDEELINYVGLTERVLRSRMDNYRDGKADQNQRLRDLIADALTDGHRVSNFGRRESDPVRLAEEEARLRSVWKPTWNRA